MSVQRQPVETQQRLRSVRMSEEETQALLDQLDRADAGGVAGRYPYSQTALQIDLKQVGATGQMGYQVPARWISESGLAFLHGGFVHRATLCEVRLITLHGNWDDVHASVMGCRLVHGRIHEIEIRFDRKIDLALYSAKAISRRVLLADDDPLSAQLATHHLEKLNARVDHAKNGRLAVDMAFENPYDLILLDLDMPEFDGFEALASLRERGYSGPIAAFSGLAKFDRTHCIDAGFDLYLAKPFTREDLEVTLSTLRTELLYSSHQNDPSMQDLVRAFVDRLPSQIGELQAAARHNDHATLLRIGRSLKETAAGCGYEPVSAAAEQLEDALSKMQSPAPELSQLDRLLKLLALVRGPA